MKKQKKLNVFADYHHQDLYHSLRLLFEDRLGGKLYKPIGLEYADQGYWSYHLAQPKENQEGVKKQYLEHWASDGQDLRDKGARLRFDRKHGVIDRMLTLEEFLKKDIDIVIASVANHEEPFKRLCELHPAKPYLVRQVGNIGEIINCNICKNIMVSSGKLNTPPPDSANTVYYHQEFDLSVYKYTQPKQKKVIKNFMNCLPNMPGITEMWERYKAELSEYKWKMHGILGYDGIIDTNKEIAQAIQDSMFIWHVKPGGDGFGHTIHNAFACGRPVITRSRDYNYDNGQLAGLLLEDRVTCIDLDKGSFEENIKLIREYSEPKRHKEMCEAVYNKFRAVVDFDKEQKMIEKFLNNLKR